MTFTPEQREEIKKILAEQLQGFIKNERYVFEKDVVFRDGRNIQTARGYGTKIGTAADQKLSVYGVTPVVQQGAISAPTTPGAAYAQSEAQSAVNAINSIITALENFGILAPN